MWMHRLVKARHAATALDGEGARRVGGRWNPPGSPVVYGASSLSLAVLELLVHVDPEAMPDDLVALRVEIPEDLPSLRLRPDELPADWRLDRGRAGLRALGLRWLQEAASAVLVVPSVIVPEEDNLLVNPGHPDAARIRIAGQRPFHLDARLR
jgi:RES domain-containing protein